MGAFRQVEFGIAGPRSESVVPRGHLLLQCIYRHFLSHAHSNFSNSRTPEVRTAESRYTAFGADRYASGTMPTSYRYTGQRLDADTGLYFYNSRYYDPALGRFTQPDTIVPDPGDPQSLNRYSYVGNNPVRYVDPSGHGICIGTTCEIMIRSDYKRVIFRKPVTSRSSALHQLTYTINQGYSDADERLTQVLKDTQSGVGVFFKGVGSIRGNSGLDFSLQDDWLYQKYWGAQSSTSRQIGHFLTAVNLGFVPLPKGIAFWLMIGHEQYTDGAFDGTMVSIAIQLTRPRSRDIMAFDLAAKLDKINEPTLRDLALETIFSPDKHGEIEGRIGNSMADLRLSVIGWNLGRAVRNGEFASNKELAYQLIVNLAGD